MISGKGRTSSRPLDIAYSGIKSDMNRAESTLKEHEVYSLGLYSSSVA